MFNRTRKIYKYINLSDCKLFSVLIPTYNNSEFLKECIDSVLIQNYPKIEIIVGDDCSDNFNISEFESYIRRNKKENVVNFIVNQNIVNLGAVKNYNKLISLSKGDYIMNLDGDDILYDEHALSTLANFLDKNNNLVVIGRLIYYYYKSNTFGDIYPNDSQVNLLKNSAQIFKYITTKYHCLPGSSFTYRKELITNYGLYDESYVLAAEYPRYLDLLSKGVKIGFVNRLIVKYRAEVGIETSKNPKIKAQRDADLALIREKEFIKLP